MQTTDLVVSLQCKKLWNIKAPAKLFVILTAMYVVAWTFHFPQLDELFYANPP